MKLFSSKYFSLIVLVCSLVGTIQATHERLDDDCCQSRCYECGCEPLYECSWGLQVNAGIRPIIWNHRGDFLGVNCGSTTILNDFGQLPKFRSLYKLPWQVGVQGSYATSCNTNIFAEFNYAQSRSKCDNVIQVGTSNLVLQLTKYKLFEGYVGARYYFNRWCDRVSFFVGGKIGFLRHKGIKTAAFSGLTDLTLIDECNIPAVNDFFSRHTSFAGGGHLGFDICVCGNWSFVITMEVIASCGPEGVNALALNTIDSAFLDASALIIPGASTELGFPITFGIKYNF